MNPTYLYAVSQRLKATNAKGLQPTALDVTIEILDQLIETEQRLIDLESRVTRGERREPA